MLNKKTVFFLIFLLLFTPQYLFSAESPSLNSLIDECLKNNPQIQAAKQRYKAALARVRLLRTLSDPKFEYEYDKINADMDAVMNGKTAPMRTFAVSQEFPFPSKLFLRRLAAQKEADAFQEDYKETENRVIKDLKTAYFQLFLSGRKIVITKENLDLLGQYIEIVNAKYSVNKAVQQDALRAQVEHSKLSNQLVLLKQEEKISQSMLNSFLSRTAQTEIIIPELRDEKILEMNEEKIIELAKVSRPELKSFKEMIRKSEIDYTLAKQEYLPDFMLRYRREENTKGGMGSWSGMIGMTVPLWFWEKQNSFVKEARANVAAAKADYQATENIVLFEARSAYAKFAAAQNLVQIYETGVLPQAQAALETARIGYQADKIDFLDLLDSQRSLREFQMEYFESLANLEIALADLERSVGAGIN